MKKLNKILLTNIVSMSAIITTTSVVMAATYKTSSEEYYSYSRTSPKTTYKCGSSRGACSQPKTVYVAAPLYTNNDYAERAAYYKDQQNTNYNNGYKNTQAEQEVVKTTPTYATKKRQNNYPAYVSLSLGANNIEGDNHSAIRTISQSSNSSTIEDFDLSYPDSSSSNFTIAVGSYVANRLKMELSYSKMSTDESYTFQPTPAENMNFNLGTDINQLLVGVEFDLITTNKFNMFIGAGAGLAQIDTNSQIDTSLTGDNWKNNDTNNDNNLSWKIKLGAEVKVADNVSVFGALSYSDLGEQNWENEGLSNDNNSPDALFLEQSAELTSQGLEIGVRLAF